MQLSFYDTHMEAVQLPPKLSFALPPKSGWLYTFLSNGNKGKKYKFTSTDGLFT